MKQRLLGLQFRIGGEFTFGEMMELCKEGKYRYEQQIPPGYKDKSNKKGMSKYDLFIWKQILKYAYSVRQDVIFISNDVKGDWWDSKYDATRMELLKKFNAATGRSKYRRCVDLYESCKSMAAVTNRIYHYRDAST